MSSRNLDGTRYAGRGHRTEVPVDDQLGGPICEWLAERPIHPPVCVLLASRNDRLRSDCRDCIGGDAHVIPTMGGVECVTLLRAFTPDVVVLDTDLFWGGADGVLAYLRTRANTPIPVVLLTSDCASSPGCASGVDPPIVAVIETALVRSSLLPAVRSAAGRRVPAGSEA